MCMYMCMYVDSCRSCLIFLQTYTCISLVSQAADFFIGHDGRSSQLVKYCNACHPIIHHKRVWHGYATGILQVCYTYATGMLLV